MKLPINFALYVISLGLLGVAGHQFYFAVDKVGGIELGGPDMNEHHVGGRSESEELVQAGREGAGLHDGGWIPKLRSHREWWDQFADANFTGKLPPKPEPVDTGETEEDTTPADQRPLDEIFTVVYVLWDEVAGDTNQSSLIIRYKPEANVEVPEGYRGILPSAAAGGAVRGDTAAGSRARSGSFSAPMPTAGGDLGVLHHLEVGGSLWKNYEHIVLVRIEEDARSAWFQRPPREEGGEPVEEEVYANELDLDSDVIRRLIEAQRAEEAGRSAPDSGRTPSRSAWQDVAETRRTGGNDWSISRTDARTFEERPDQMLERVGLRSYDRGGRRGILVTNIDPGLSSRFGFQQGDLILEVNGTPVRSRSHAINVGKKMYQRGTRTFRVRVLSAGREETRVYHAPGDEN